MEDSHEFIQATGSFSLRPLSVHMNPIRRNVPLLGASRLLEAKFNWYSLPLTTIMRYILASSSGMSALFDITRWRQRKARSGDDFRGHIRQRVGGTINCRPPAEVLPQAAPKTVFSDLTFATSAQITQLSHSSSQLPTLHSKPISAVNTFIHVFYR